MSGSKKSELDCDLDVQDAFDSLLLCEESFVEKGFEEGITAGEAAGLKEGFELGQKKGREIGSEIGFYRGFAKGWITIIRNPDQLTNSVTELLENCGSSISEDTSSRVKLVTEKVRETSIACRDEVKALKQLEKLLQLTDSFPEENRKDQDFLEKLSAVRAKFKHCCALLKVSSHSGVHNHTF